MVRFSKGSQSNDVTFHSVWNGERWVTVPSYSPADPFAKIGTEAIRAVGSKPRGPVTTADIDAMYALAQRVHESYGELAVGTLPSLPTKEEAA